MSRAWKIAIAVTAVLLIFAVLSIPTVVRTILGLRKSGANEAQARREIIQVPISTPTDMPVMAQIYWASAVTPGTLEATPVELPLSADPAQRSKQLITELITKAPTPAQASLPADATLQQFYLLPDGTAIADFSDALGTETPSGILSEEMAVDSIVRTLGANVSAVHQLKILIHGQEAETLAGHIDLTGFFPVMPPATADGPATTDAPVPASAPFSPSPTASSAVPAATPQAAPAPAPKSQ